jgi:putative transposase
LRQLSRIIFAMIAMTGRVTMLGISRWAEKGGSYRTVQRLFYTVIPWAQVLWAFFCGHLLDSQDAYLLAGDECVVTKTGKQTHGLDYFFSSLRQKAVSGLSFLTLALVSTRQRHSYPICVEQMIRTEEEKAASQAKKQAKKAKPAHPKRKPGRPKGSRNKNKAEVVLNPELQRIQKMLQSFLNTIQGKIHLTYLVLDGHFGNHPAFHMVRQCQLHLISKLRYDAALHFPYSGPSPKRGPRARLGEQVDVRSIPEEYLKETNVEDGFETCT